MDAEPGANAPKPNRRAPAQKAAQQAGLPGDVFLHQNAMGGFTQSGRKPKRLKPGILGAKAAKGTRKKASVVDTQRSLDAVPDDDVVVVASMPGPRGRVEVEDTVEPDTFPLAVKGLEDAARAAILQALYHDVGRPQSLITHPKGVSFSIRPGLGAGEAHSNHRVRVPLPGGNSTTHVADLCIELDNGAMLVIDILTAQSQMSEVKSRAFDALQLRGLSQCYAVLVFVHGKAGLERDHVEAVAHGFDHFFGVGDDHVADATKYTALKARVAQWIKAAGAKA